MPQPCQFCGRAPEKRKPRGVKRDRILAAFDANPKLSSYMIADALEIEPNHVRKVLSRHGRKLARHRGSHALP